NVLLAGRPGPEIQVLPEPQNLYLPLSSRRFNFGEICVKDGEKVSGGDVLAKDPDNHSVPLLAPRAGTVRLKAAENHIVLEDVALLEEHADMAQEELEHIRHEAGQAGVKRYQMLALGAWQFFYDAYSSALPEPLGTPQAIIVSTMSLEPFLARGDAQLHKRLLSFTRGLEQLQSLLEYQPIYLVMPDISSEFATLVRTQIRGYAWVKMVEVPLTYPWDNFALLARKLGLSRDGGPVWSVRTEGVLAVDRALTLTKPCTVRIVSIGGPAVNSPVHLKVMAGYPIEKIVEECTSDPAVRVINGGVLTGRAMAAETLGVDTECTGLTVIPEPVDRESFSFARPGSDRHSYSNCFLSALKADFRERLTTAARGELRPCVSCNFCEEVCPAGIMPHLIHKLLYKDDLDEVERARVDLCVGCGLCSFVCPSKIELTGQMLDAQQRIRVELQATAETSG
ncbi:MAG: 4Fe-4S dicluster domain-containing protein, partial [Planctomycetota bacterium]